jgi:FAD binding domain
MRRVGSRMSKRSWQHYRRSHTCFSMWDETLSTSSNSRMVFLATVSSVLAVCSIACAYPNKTDLEQRQPLSELLMRVTSAESRDRGIDDQDDTTDIINWSGTHKVTVANKNYWEPDSVQEVEQIIRECHQRGQPVRPIGSSLSPNGIALNAAGMISMANVDRVLEVDTKNRTITVEAGITVNKVGDLGLSLFVPRLILCYLLAFSPNLNRMSFCMDCR